MFNLFLNKIFLLYLNFIYTISNEYIDLDRFFENNEESIYKKIYNKIHFNSEENNTNIIKIIENKKYKALSHINRLTSRFDKPMNLDLKKFELTVYETMKRIENKSSKKNIKDKNKTKSVIDNIYNAANKCKATQIQLLVFTAIALNNNNSFFDFSCYNNDNNDNNDNNYGLLQLSYSKYHEIIEKSNKKSNYQDQFYLTNEFNESEILEEFKFFQKYIFKKKDEESESAYNCYLKTLLNINHQEFEILSYDCIKKLFKNKINNYDKEIYIDSLNNIDRKYTIFKILLSSINNIKFSTKY